MRDIEAALRVYRDALGLVVVEDKALAGVGIARMVGLAEAALRIVHLAEPGPDYGLQVRLKTPKALARYTFTLTDVALP